jgi:hypothetical protein
LLPKGTVFVWRALKAVIVTNVSSDTTVSLIVGAVIVTNRGQSRTSVGQMVGVSAMRRVSVPVRQMSRAGAVTVAKRVRSPYPQKILWDVLSASVLGRHPNVNSHRWFGIKFFCLKEKSLSKSEIQTLRLSTHLS